VAERASARDALFRAIVEHAREGVWVLDAAGTTTFANDAFAAMLGNSADAMIGLPLSRVMASAAVDRAELLERRADRDGRRQLHLRHRNGALVVCEATSVWLAGAGTPDVVVVYAAGSVRDEPADAAPAVPHVDRIMLAMEQHVYSGELTPGGAYRERFAGPGLERLVGATTREQACAADWDALVFGDDRPAYVEFGAALRAGQSAELDYRVVGLDGIVRWVRDAARPREHRADGTVVIDGLVTDITAEHAAADELEEALVYANDLAVAIELARADAEQASRTDALTSLANRREFLARVETIAAGDDADGLCVLMADLDHFKLVNDTYGHAAGDRVLIAAANALRAAMREEDVVARWGGEEFVVAGVVRDDEALRSIGERLLRAVAAINERGLPRLAASIGAARSGGRAVDDLVAAADAALYAAKRRGRARVVLECDLTPEDAEQSEPDDVRLARALARAACARTGRPLRSVERVAETAALIARRMGLDAATTRDCILAAWLHDVDELTLPNDRATGAHPRTLVGARLLEDIPQLARTAAIVRHQDEHFDGTGAPVGLAGDAIPLPARVLAVALTYTAEPRTSTAGHRAAERPSIEAVRAAAGRQLDPDVAHALEGASEAAA
jgi:diguanylate cyclase (GGDEF)-like protein/PAS domain S-box-containing protein